MKNKLVIFIGTLQSGGAERVVSEISSMYADYFKEVIVLTYYDGGVFYKMDPRVRLKCVESITHSRNIVKNIFALRRFVKRESPDVFLSFLLPLNILAIWSLMFLHIPVAVCERSDPQKVGSRWLRGLRNFSYRFCNGVQVQTSAGKTCFPASVQKKIFVIPNPNHVTLDERSWALKQEKEKRIVTVGRLIPEKNPRLLIDAFSMLTKKFSDYSLEFYGEGVLRSMMMERICELGLTDKVILHGNVNDVPHHIASAEIFVISSDLEGMPNALMEAMALGLPCVATDVSGVRDIITDGENGFVVPIGDKEALADRVIKLIESEDLKKRFSENSAIVLSKFDNEKVFKLWLELVNIKTEENGK